MLDFINSVPRTILEIGCGTGKFRQNFNSIEYWGVEPCATAAAEASKTLSRVITGLYDDVQTSIPDQNFDLIVCNDVIEHMPDPKKFLKGISTKLNPNGILIASVPNLRNAVPLFELLAKGDFSYSEAGGILDYTHFHLFTRKSFIRMATECGWQIDCCRPINKQPFKPIKRLALAIAKTFIPEIEFLQIGFRLKRPATCSSEPQN